MDLVTRVCHLENTLKQVRHQNALLIQKLNMILVQKKYYQDRTLPKRQARYEMEYKKKSLQLLGLEERLREKFGKIHVHTSRADGTKYVVKLNRNEIARLMKLLDARPVRDLIRKDQFIQ